MAQYLNKSAVVAMIKHHIKEEPHSYFCKCLLSEIDTLEVKEEPKLTVDDIMRLDALLINMWNNHNSYEEVLRQFKTQKGEEHDRD